MHKKTILIVISIVSAVLLLCGLSAFAAAAPGSSAASTSLTGAFKSIDKSGAQMTVTTDKGDQTLPLAKSVWVYRNEQKAQLSDLQAGDRIEAILNSKNQAAYVKASSPAAPSAPAAPPAAPTAAPSSARGAGPATATPPAAPPAPQANGGPSGASPKATQQAPQQQAQAQAQGVYPGLDGLDVEVDGSHFKLHIMQKRSGSGSTQYELNLKPEGSGAVHLKGGEAEAWIKQLLAAVDLKSGDASQQLLQEIAGHYGIDAGKLHVQMKAQWGQASASAQQQDNGSHDNDDEHDDGQASAHGKKVDDRGKHIKSHAHDEQD